MEIIYKYELPLPITTLQLPGFAQIRHIGSQGEGTNEGIFIWAEVNKERTSVSRQFHVFSTGVELNLTEDFFFIGTVQMNNGLVFHIYEKVI